MNKKNLTKSLLLGVVGSLVLAGAALADDIAPPTLPPVTSAEVTTAPTESVPKAVNQEKNLKRLISRGEALINTRLASLASQKTKVQNSKLTTEQKNALVLQIDATVAKLNDLKAKLKATTNVEDARALVKSIYTDYRVYAVEIPKINLTMSLNALRLHLDKLPDVFAKVQEKIDALAQKNAATATSTVKAKTKAQKNAETIAARQAGLNAAKAMVPAIQAKLDATVAKLITVKPADYPTASKTVFSEVRTAAKEIRQMLQNLNKELRKK